MNAGSWVRGMVVAGVVAGSVCAVMAEEGAKVSDAAYIVKTMGMDRKIETVVMPEADYKALENTLKLEQKYFSKAVSLAAKEWRADEANKGITFPGSMLKPRSIMVAQRFATAAKADEQMTKIEEQEAKKKERAAEKEKKMRRGAPLKKDSKRDDNLALAADLVKAKLGELVAGNGAEPAAAGAAPAAAKVEGGGADMGAKADKEPHKKDAKEAK